MTHPVTARFKLAAKGLVDARPVFRCELLADGEPTGEYLRLKDWSQDADRGQPIEARAQLTILDDVRILPRDPEGLTVPYGYEFKLYAGFDYLDGSSPELVSRGVFGVWDVDDVTRDGHAITVVGYDRSKALQEAKFEAFYTPPTDVDYAAAAEAMLQDRLPWAVSRFHTTGFTTPGNVILGGERGGDPLADMTKWFEAVGHELRVDADGVFYNRPVPDLDDLTVTVTFNDQQHKALEITRSVSRDDWYNAVVITGERAGREIVQARKIDNNPNSPTYYYGKVKRVLVEQSELARDQEQAQAMCEAKFRKHFRRSDRYAISAPLDPSIETWDVAHTVSPSAGVDAVQLVDTLTMGPRGMTLNGASVERRALRAIRPDRSVYTLPVRYHWAQVLSAGGGTATISLGGVTVSDVPYAKGLTPTLGDQASVRLRGSEAFIDTLVA